MDGTDIVDRIRALPCTSVPHPIYRIYCYRRVCYSFLRQPRQDGIRKCTQFKKEKNRVQQKQGQVLKSVLSFLCIFSISSLFRPVWYLVLFFLSFVVYLSVFPPFHSQFIRPHRIASVHVPVFPPFSAP